MNKTKIAIAALLLSAASAFAQHAVTMEWDANDPKENVTGYRIYQKVVTPPPDGFPGNPSPAISWKLVGEVPSTQTRFTAQNVPGGTVTYAVTAFNKEAESARSDELNAIIISAPKGARIVTIAVTP